MMEIHIHINQTDDGALAGTVTVTDWTGVESRQSVHVRPYGDQPENPAAHFMRCAARVYWRLSNVARGQVDQTDAHDLDAEKE